MSVDEVDAPARPEAVPDDRDSGNRRGGRRERRGSGRSFADRWPFRRKLTILVGAPLIVIVLLLGYLFIGLIDQARAARTEAQLVRDSRQVAELLDRVETEHQQAILLSVRYESATSGTRPSLVAFRQARAAVDTQVEKVSTTFGSRLPAAEVQVLREINGLGDLRTIIEQSYLPADNIDPAYTAVETDLIAGLGLDKTGLTVTTSLLDSLLRADAAHSSFETAVFSAQTGDTNALIEFTGAVGFEQLYTYQADRFGRFSSESEHSELAGMEQGTTWNAISMQYATLQIDPGSLVAATPAEVKESFTTALQAYPDFQQLAQSRLKITNSLIAQIAGRADQASKTAWLRAICLLAAAWAGFILWLAFSVTIRRSVVRPVQALTGAAIQVADVAGQELARVADDDAEYAGPPRLREVPVTAHDEIGDLADAFNRVQSTAAALLERQVLSRRNVAEMFGNVGRRVSNLTARQLSLIDALERGETDPVLLERLYRIDHLAVRLQRNADSLMLLAGIREAGLDASPTALTNVVRAALGQIEGYQRVSLYAETDVTVAPDIIADLTLMLAELLENAVAFSPARSPVEVSVRNGSDGALIDITDHGLGMSAERLAEENARLIRRERLDLVPTKVLGLFVVGSLARRWGVRVTLSRTPGGGVTSRVSIPVALLLLMSPFAEPTATDHAKADDVPADDARPARMPLPERRAPLSLPAAEAPAERTGETPVSWPVQMPAEAPAPAEPWYAGSEPPTSRPTTPATTRPAIAGVTGITRAIESGDGPGRPGGSDVPAAPALSAVSPLPRRVSHRQAPGWATRGEEAPQPADASAAPVSAGAPLSTSVSSAGDDPADDSARPLRRRVRGATLRTVPDEDVRPAARQAPRPADAEEVRSELDEFEAAVERAQRDSADTTAPGTRVNEAGFSEGAEQ